MEGVANRCSSESNGGAEVGIAEFCHSLHDAALGFRGRTAGRPRYLDDSLGAKLDSLLVFSFGNAVGEEQEAITGNQLFRRVRVRPIGKNAEHAALATQGIG